MVVSHGQTSVDGRPDVGEKEELEEAEVDDGKNEDKEVVGDVQKFKNVA